MGRYHLACLADADKVARLRGPDRPIVSSRRRRGARVAAAVARGVAALGVMLPYSPLHHLLLGDAGETLVMTSGNVSDEPIAYGEEDALERLAGIADRFLVHDRPITTRTDDSVVRGPLVIRPRGIVAAGAALPVPAERPLLAWGAELHAVFCLAKCARASVGHHIGDQENGETLVATEGGVFQNRVLLERTRARLDAAGLRVLVPRRFPVNDGGIAFGQAAVAACRTGS